MTDPQARKPSDIAHEIEGTDAGAVLLDDGTPYRSFCGGSDTLEKLGLITPNDGEVTDLGIEVRALLRSYAQIDAAARS